MTNLHLTKINSPSALDNTATFTGNFELFRGY